MKKFLLGLVIIFLFAVLTMGSKSLEDDINGLVTYVSENRVGKYPDVWLEKYLSEGDWTKVVLFFGFVDNDANCELLKESYESNILYANKYRCMRAN